MQFGVAHQRAKVKGCCKGLRCKGQCIKKDVVEVLGILMRMLWRLCGFLMRCCEGIAEMGLLYA